MIFIETSIFTRRVLQFLTEDSYAALQQVLLLGPATGPLISGSGGLRKVRWRLPGMGKRGGVRIIYYHDVGHDTIFLLFIYQKSQQEDLTSEQIQILRQLVEEWLHERE